MTRRWTAWCAVAIVAVVAGYSKSADNSGPVAEGPPTTAPTGAAAALWRPTTHPGCFDPGDLLEVRVWDLDGPETTSAIPVHVLANGAISLPLLKRAIPVALVDRVEGAKRVAAAYR